MLLFAVAVLGGALMVGGFAVIWVNRRLPRISPETKYAFYIECSMRMFISTVAFTVATLPFQLAVYFFTPER